VIRLGTIVLGAGDVDRAVSFWSAVLGYRAVPFPDEDDEFTILVPPSGEGTRVALHRSDTVPEAHPRVHLDLVVDDASEQATEIERLVGLGATRVPWDSYPVDPTSSCLPIRRGTASVWSTPAMADVDRSISATSSRPGGGQRQISVTSTMGWAPGSGVCSIRRRAGCPLTTST
jgi:Glyoxalase-like domain